jgi:hypothetical protein
MQGAKKKAAVQLPAVAKEAPVEEKFDLEFEALRDIAELVDVDGSSPASFLEGVRDADVSHLTAC